MNERSIDGWRTDPRLRQSRTVRLDSGDPDEKRAEIRQYFHDTFDIDEALLEVLLYDETFYRRADPLRHPLIFYFGHTAVFYINKLLIAKLIDHRINPSYESMFAVGVDEMSWDDLDERHYDWPSVADVQAYRDQVRETVDRIISELPLKFPLDWNSPWWAIVMGIEHARIHLETSSVLIRQLPIDQVRTHPLWEDCPRSGDAPENSLIPVSAKQITLGKDRVHPLYGWDNEYGTYTEEVSDFRAAQYLVTNAEFLSFVEDTEGYTDDRWWTEEGRRWRHYKDSKCPIFWIPTGGTYRFRTVTRETDMPWDWPVEVNYLEAKAFCNWKSAQTGESFRLPTEAEWYRLRDSVIDTDQPYWDRAPGNINLEHYASSCPVTEFKQGDFFDVVGNVWQWTETPITGYKGFQVHPYYDDFSTPTFDGQHNLIKGGSWISTGNEATRDSRYAFRRHFFQHAGFRYIQSQHEVVIETDVYETDPAVAQYCEAHYGETYFNVPNFPREIARFCLELTTDRPRRKALDLGCAVGRSTFELADGFELVQGLDFSARFIRIGVNLLERGRVRYARAEEGDLISYHEKSLTELGLEAPDGRIEFWQADACNLKSIFNDYDLVLASNLIDRLPQPRKFLSMIHERIAPGGLLVIASPYSWSEQFTERDQWLGGTRQAGEPYTTLEGIRDTLSPHFRQVCQPRTIPFVLRETARKFQHVLSEVTVWEHTE